MLDQKEKNLSLVNTNLIITLKLINTRVQIIKC